MFGKLRVWDTEHNNGVLIYLLLAEHAIEIVADRGLDAHVEPRAQWARIVAGMREAFRAGRFEEGLNAAIDAVDALLRQHFPLGAAQANPTNCPTRSHVRRRHVSASARSESARPDRENTSRSAVRLRAHAAGTGHVDVASARIVMRDGVR